MQLKKIKITNVASLVDFCNNCDFKKNNLFFGTNGSGKSTLVELLYHLNRYYLQNDSQSQDELKTFFREHFSKESRTEIAEVNITINSNNTTITYNKNLDIVKASNSTWTPIKIFNEQYTERTICRNFNMELKNSGIIIGEKNIELEKEYEKKKKLEEQNNNILNEAKSIVENTVKKYRTITRSSADVNNTINTSTLFNDYCDLKYDTELIKERENLGFGRVDTTLTRLEEQQIKLKYEFKDIETSCMEKVSSPKTSANIIKLLKDYTGFYTKGLEIFEKTDKQTCPFCLRDWINAEEKINEYDFFIKSTYNFKRDFIKKIISSLEDYKKQIEDQSIVVDERRKLAAKEAGKYGIDMTKWLPLKYDNKLHASIISLLQKKFDYMELSLSVIDQLNMLHKKNMQIIMNNNAIIDKILEKIRAITSLRMKSNKKLVDHFAKKMWKSSAELRKQKKETDVSIRENKLRIEKLEKENPPQDTIRTVFNRLLNFIGLFDYSIDENKRLRIRIDKEYDISNEGKRISSAQRKILSLCYFFAEIISEIKDIKKLKEYILVFDDPVDSADYIYFHSIVSVIEKAETILASILEVEKIKFGQFFVLTHNSLLHDRMSCGWKCKSKLIKKENSVTSISPSAKSINNYHEYISDICNYYKNPDSSKKRMIYIGNLIRRVLEIVSSFDSLESNNFQNILDGMSKTKLAILANHLSHESFSKVLNPLSEPDEIKEACKELLEVISKNHPAQFETIQKRFEIKLCP